MQKNIFRAPHNKSQHLYQSSSPNKHAGASLNRPSLTPPAFHPNHSMILEKVDHTHAHTLQMSHLYVPVVRLRKKARFAEMKARRSPQSPGDQRRAREMCCMPFACAPPPVPSPPPTRGGCCFHPSAEVKRREEGKKIRNHHTTTTSTPNGMAQRGVVCVCVCARARSNGLYRPCSLYNNTRPYFYVCFSFAAFFYFYTLPPRLVQPFLPACALGFGVLWTGFLLCTYVQRRFGKGG